MRYSINLVQEPNQEFSCNLERDGEIYICDIKLRTLSDGQLIADIEIDGDKQRSGVMCQDRMPLLYTDKYGMLYFEDQYGTQSPTYEGLGERYLLIYNTEYSLG